MKKRKFIKIYEKIKGKREYEKIKMRKGLFDNINQINHFNISIFSYPIK